MLRHGHHRHGEKRTIAQRICGYLFEGSEIIAFFAQLPQFETRIWNVFTKKAIFHCMGEKPPKISPIEWISKSRRILDMQLFIVENLARQTFSELQCGFLKTGSLR